MNKNDLIMTVDIKYASKPVYLKSGKDTSKPYQGMCQNQGM